MDRTKGMDGDKGELNEFVYRRERANAQMLDDQSGHIVQRILRLMSGLDQRQVQLSLMAPSDCEALLSLLRECEAIFQETDLYPCESG